MTSIPEIVSVRDLYISFEGSPALNVVNGISFAMGMGKTLAMVGESGSGKSLTALSLMGLLPKNATIRGALLLHREQTLSSQVSTIDLATADRRTLADIRGKEIGMVFQEPMSALNPVMRVGEQLRESISTHQPLARKQAERQAIAWLGRVQLPDPENSYKKYPHQLSGGQKQRVMIAMAMCNHPALLIADEPTTALDATVQQDIVQLMQYLQQEHHSAMLFITHDLALAATIADDVLVLFQGQAMEYGPANQVLQQPAHPYTQALLACRPSAEHKGKRLPVVADFLEREPTAQTTPPASPHLPIESDTLLDVRNLGVWFAASGGIGSGTTRFFKAVDDVSFVIKKGEVLGVVGESGSGKSTIGKALTGLLPVQAGQMLFSGTDLTTLPPPAWREMRRQIQMIFQDPYSSLNPRMTIGDALSEPLLVHGIVPKGSLATEIKRLLHMVQLPTDAMNKYPHQFSGGQRQRIGIARALALRPQLLICDESVSALDLSIQAQILNLLKELQAELRLTLLFIAHDLSVVHYISDSVMVMQRGKIVETGAADQVLHHPTQSYTRALIDAIPSSGHLLA